MGRSQSNGHASFSGRPVPERPRPRKVGRTAGPASVLEQPLPMLASACPGWVCYAEKTHGDYILPHISTTKSPQVCADGRQPGSGVILSMDPHGLLHT